MGISNYLHEKSKEAVLRDSKKESIKKSIRAIKERIDEYFDDVDEHFIFGSYTRNTILPRSIDERADIDYMVVFEDNELTPQAYLNKLKKFVNKYYSQSEIKQSHPTIQLELNHITFELVPALNTGWFGKNYQIPSRNNGVDEWIDTDPNGFNKELTEANQGNKSLIKPLIRLLKYWNAKNGYIFASYVLEKDIVAVDYFWVVKDKSLKDYFYKYVESIEVDYSMSQLKQDKANKLKERVEDAKNEDNNQKAENIIRKIFKDEDVKNESNSSTNVLALPYVEQPKWQMTITNSVDINATSDGCYFNSGELLDKSSGLTFKANVNVQKPFSVHWQVVNTGQEAKNANCLRGGIYPAKTAGAGGLTLKERTGYTGTHWVECFIIKDNRCVARSGEFIVKVR